MITGHIKKKMRTIHLLAILAMMGSVMAADISDILTPVQGQYEIVWAYNASDTADPWKKYVPGAPAWANDLEQMVPDAEVPDDTGSNCHYLRITDRARWDHVLQSGLPELPVSASLGLFISETLSYIV